MTSQEGRPEMESAGGEVPQQIQDEANAWHREHYRAGVKRLTVATVPSWIASDGDARYAFAAGFNEALDFAEAARLAAVVVSSPATPAQEWVKRPGSVARITWSMNPGQTETVEAVWRQDRGSRGGGYWSTFVGSAITSMFVLAVEPMRVVPWGGQGAGPQSEDEARRESAYTEHRPGSALASNSTPAASPATPNGQERQDCTCGHPCSEHCSDVLPGENDGCLNGWLNGERGCDCAEYRPVDEPVIHFGIDWCELRAPACDPANYEWPSARDRSRVTCPDCIDAGFGPSPASPAETREGREALARRIEALRGYLPGGDTEYAEGFYEGIATAAATVRAASPAAVPLPEETERMRQALKLIATHGCSNQTSGRCSDDPNRSPIAQYGAEKWCDECIAAHALAAPSLPGEQPGGQR